MNIYPEELICFRNGKKSITKLVNPQGGIRLYSHKEGDRFIDTVGGRYGISYTTNRYPFTYRSKLLKDWKLKRQTLQQIDHGDILRHNWEIIKVDDIEYVQMYDVVTIRDKIRHMKRFAICPTFIYNWCKIFYYDIKEFHLLPKTIKGKTFVERFKIALEYVREHNDRYKLLPEDFIRLERFYHAMKKHGYLKERYKIKPKLQLY